ncbi:trimeric intracellular cation channel family protein [Ammoniphilus sp. CFH 90114]|uniref:trimeric intracellular cation channel family protein n=1 Tax=Ammoniphilus sp. CFH 90114 TaxID=2493665 RepID=UPI00100F8C51|nr:trimeric intracellular cation channel family protein [Ammoniphilus sp. CFH 90114]RXT04179.1 trimeric intracellular cation channel family protein [Ammoniphilus sp. CFH 90114]
MIWDVLNIVGTIAFAASGAIVAMEEKYDILGVYILGLVTAFGGGVVRNLLIGIPVPTLWEQESLIEIALVTVTLIFFLPHLWMKHLKQWTFFDAIGLAAFAVQGAIYATEKQLPLGAIMVAALLTGIGGGVIRDVLAGRKPLVFREEIYAAWAILAGVVIGKGWAQDNLELSVLFISVVILRMVSVTLKWRLPRRTVSVEYRNKTEGF